VAALLGVAFIWQRTDAAVRQNASEEAASLADLIATSFTLIDSAAREKPASPGQVHGLVSAAMRADFQIVAHVRELRVIDRGGTVRWSRRVEELGTRLPEAKTLLGAPPQGKLDSRSGEYVRPLGGMACARCHAGDAFQVGTVQVLLSHPRLADDVGNLYLNVVLGILLLALATFLVTSLTMRAYVTRPLLRLSEVMRRAEKGDILTRAKVESRDEVGQLASAFNSMLSRITELKVAEIETSREMDSMQRELALKEELERQHGIIEQTNRALERRVRDVTLLFDVTRSLNSTLELEEILSRVTELVGVRMAVHQFAVMLLDEKAGDLVVKATFGFKEPRELLDRFRLPLGKGACGIAAQTKEPVFITDVRSDPRYVKGPSDPDGDACLLAVPMVCKEKLVGVLNFVREGTSAFTETDIMLLDLVGTQAAMAIVNARLFAETVELTLVDALTGAFNRRHLFARLEMELARAQRFDSKVTIVMIDIDHFKHFNDTCGHPAGDRILRETAQMLKKTVRKVDTVARYGGEEFMVVLPLIGRAEGQEVAEKLRRAVERTKFEDGDRQPGGKVTISVGVATYPDDGTSLEKVVDCVDSALYASKRGGRNLVTLYSPGMESHPGRERGPGGKKKKRRADGAADPDDGDGLEPSQRPRTISGELAAIPEPIPGARTRRPG
jgi:diguanylate cyclase (GGDEF)-like protein